MVPLNGVYKKVNDWFGRPIYNDDSDDDDDEPSNAMTLAQIVNRYEPSIKLLQGWCTFSSKKCCQVCLPNHYKTYPTMNFGPWGMMNPMGHMVPSGYGPQPFFCNGNMPYAGMPYPQMNMMVPPTPFQDSMHSYETKVKFTR
ncbi:hypothetical protein cypCar_00018085 [Cyprinus carpio]|nr:hypothetical protein cypCar_00018085 [Cyprinus carpio]